MNIIEALSGTNNLDITNYQTLLKILRNLSISLKKDLLERNVIKENGYLIFEQEFKLYKYQKNELGQAINSIITGPYLLIPFNYEDFSEGKLFLFKIDYPQLLNINLSELDTFRMKSIFFITFYDFL